jgi:hypothetical protein
MNILEILYESHLLEVLTFFAPLRFFWSQTLETNLGEARYLPLFAFCLKRRSLRNSILLDRIATIQKSESTDLKAVLREQEELRGAINEFNVINEESEWKKMILAVLVMGCLLYWNPLLLVSLLIGDLITTRVHQHILSCF